jgi:hypothetical protein
MTKDVAECDQLRATGSVTPPGTRTEVRKIAGQLGFCSVMTQPTPASTVPRSGPQTCDDARRGVEAPGPNRSLTDLHRSLK